MKMYNSITITGICPINCNEIRKWNRQKCAHTPGEIKTSSCYAAWNCNSRIRGKVHCLFSWHPSGTHKHTRSLTTGHLQTLLSLRLNEVSSKKHLMNLCTLRHAIKSAKSATRKYIQLSGNYARKQHRAHTM